MSRAGGCAIMTRTLRTRIAGKLEVMDQSSGAIKAIELGRLFFEDVLKPAMARDCPHLLALSACGRFGYGSECLGMDDDISRDHHWGARVDLLLPDAVQSESRELLNRLAASLPKEFRGYRVEAGHVGSPGLSADGLESFLTRTIGRTSAPVTWHDWLDMPEEDIVHVVNGEVWHDPLGDFSHIRETLNGYYPDPVWKRRIAHWCRHASGMGLYALRRAMLRENRPYAFTTFSRCLKWTMELAFLLNRRYFPYDKWLYPMFRQLPDLADEMTPWIEEAAADGTAWARRSALLEMMHDAIDRRLVGLRIISPHPKFEGSETSGYRLLEHAYGELCQTLPPELLKHVPVWDQKYLESFHTGFTAGLTLESWDHMLNLKTRE